MKIARFRMRESGVHARKTGDTSVYNLAMHCMSTDHIGANTMRAIPHGGRD